MRTILYSCDGCGKQSDSQRDFRNAVIYECDSYDGVYELCKECYIRIGKVQIGELQEIRKENGRR